LHVDAASLWNVGVSLLLACRFYYADAQEVLARLPRRSWTTDLGDGKSSPK
jgi:hypothetical protein